MAAGEWQVKARSPSPIKDSLALCHLVHMAEGWVCSYSLLCSESMQWRLRLFTVRIKVLKRFQSLLRTQSIRNRRLLFKNLHMHCLGDSMDLWFYALVATGMFILSGHVQQSRSARRWAHALHRKKYQGCTSCTSF